MDTFGYSYKNAFDPIDPSSNRNSSVNYGCSNQQFGLSAFLQSGTVYILVVTTYDENTTGPFSILTIGSATVRFTRLGKLAYEMNFVVHEFRLDLLPGVQSTYSSTLNASSAIYFRESCGIAKHYYQVLQINVSVSGHYGFRSSSSMVVYGYLYRERFNPIDPSRNLIVNDDNS